MALHSCENSIENETAALNSKLVPEPDAALVANTDTLKDLFVVEETAELKALKERMKELAGAKLKADLLSNDYVTSDNLWAMRELKFVIKSKDNNGGRNYLSTNGAGKEMTFEYKKGGSSFDISQQFYFKIRPSTGGIPYLIYSEKDKTPITVGSYGGSTNYLLMTKKEDTGSVFGASWDLKAATNSPGYMIIENQDLVGQGTGGWGDIYYYVAQMGSDNKTSLGKYTQNAKQEFAISPVDSFELKEIKYINEYSARATPRTNLEVKASYTNTKTSRVDYDMPITPTVNENSNYYERKTIAFGIKNVDKIMFKRPEVIKGKVFLEPSQNSEALAHFSPSHTITRKLNTILPLSVPRRTRIDVIYYYAVYDVEAEFEMTAVYNNVQVKLVGTWNGRLHVDEIADQHILKKTDLDTGEVTSLRVNTSNTNRLAL